MIKRTSFLSREHSPHPILGRYSLIGWVSLRLFNCRLPFRLHHDWHCPRDHPNLEPFPLAPPLRMDVSVAPLRQFPHLLQETAELVNVEWPRSLSARYSGRLLGVFGRSGEAVHTSLSHRMASLEEGGAALPCSLVMLYINPQLGRSEVVGHARLVAAAGWSEAALVETGK